MAQASDFERWLGDFEGGKLRGLHSTANGILKVARLLLSGVQLSCVALASGQGKEIGMLLATSITTNIF